MKKLLFRKLLLDCLNFFLITLISTTIIIWVFQAVNFLDIMIEDGRDYLIYINYSILHFPKTLSKLYPFILFFSLFYVTIKSELNNELIIFWNFGINKIEIINFILRISLILLIIQIILTSFIIPKSQDIARSYLRDSSVNFFGNFIKPQRFNDSIRNVTIYTERKDVDGNLSNLYLKKVISGNEFVVIYAKEGSIIEKNGSPFLVLYDGEQITSKNNQITNISFSKSDFPLKNLETNTTTYKKTQELDTHSLYVCARDFYFYNKKEVKKIQNCTNANLKNIFREIYKRIFIPVYIPLLSILPFILFFYSKENSFYPKIRIITFLLGILFIVISETSIRLISENINYNLSLFLIPVIFIITLYTLYIKKFNPKLNITND